MEYGLLGEHLSHSFSKSIHEKVGKYPYQLFEVAPGDLSFFLMNKSFKAINVTIPYKEKVIPYLDELDESAKIVGAVNCIVNKQGKLIGYNTDMYGFICLLEHAGIDVSNKNVLVLGNGGASKAVIGALKYLKAKDIFIASIGKEENTISYEEIYNHPEIDVIVNATPVGMYPHNEDKELVDLDRFNFLFGVIDVIYNPIRTKIVLKAKEKGIKAEGGLYMLIAQAYKAIEIFIGKKFSKKEMDQTYREILNQNENIVLIGMPSSGKSTIAKALKKQTGLKVIDTDKEIIKIIGMPIKDYFAKYGEESFRKAEMDIIDKIYQKAPFIISTGGGVIKNKNNIDKFKQNGSIYFINRSLENLTPTKSRPLSNDENKLKELYQERLPLYQKYSDIEIDNNSDINQAVNKILESREI